MGQVLSFYSVSLHNAFRDQVSPEGQNLAAIAAGVTERDIVFSQYSHGATGLYSAVTSDLKYIYSAADNRWVFDLRRDPQETHNFANNPSYENVQAELKRRLMTRFQKDGYLEPLEGDDWRMLEPSRVPDYPDALLLFQDPTG